MEENNHLKLATSDCNQSESRKNSFTDDTICVATTTTNSIGINLPRQPPDLSLNMDQNMYHQSLPITHQIPPQHPSNHGSHHRHSRHSQHSITVNLDDNVRRDKRNFSYSFIFFL